jgi:signal transduction histidine kinase
MKIRNRLLAAFAVLALLLGVPLAYGISRLVEVSSIAVTLRGRQGEALAALNSLRAGLIETDRQARNYVIAPDPQYRTGLRAALTTAGTAVQRLQASGYGAHARAAAVRLDSLAATATTLEALVEARRAADATAFLKQAVQPALADVQDELGALGDAINQASNEAAAAAQAITAGAIRTASIAAGLALLLGAGVAFWAVAVLVQPLRRLRANMAAVAGGTLVAGDLPYDRRDEIGDLARSFRSMTEQLAELDRMRGEFLNVVSHDLKAPLNMIGSCAELIDEESGNGLPPAPRELLESIRSHVRLLTERVNKLLSLGRLEARAYPVNPEELPVAATFEELVSAFAPQARRQGLEFGVQVEPTAPALVNADPECLYHEVIGNLLSNAFKFTPYGGKVAVRVWGEEDGLHFSVADTGAGIPADKLPLVFSKYYQVGRGGADAGVGLGLAIARQVVEAHGGRITVENAEPSGAVFHVMLPAVPRSRVTPPRRAPVAPQRAVTREWQRKEVAAGER